MALRQLFRDKGVLEKVASGEYTAELLDSKHPSPPKADEPECTLSQIIGYFTGEDREIARAHQYLRPDGTLGASKKPDPKEVFYKGVLYYLPLG